MKKKPNRAGACRGGLTKWSMGEREVGGDGHSGGAGREKNTHDVGSGVGSVGTPGSGP